MKILIFSQYFWPENFRINDIANFLSLKNNNVTVVTGYPNYPEGKLFNNFKNNKKKFSRYGKINIIRIPIILRGNSKFQLFFNYLSFIISGLVFVFFSKHQKYDRIFFYGTSPITSAIPALLLSKKKNIPISMWLLDYWPYTLKDIGIIKSKFVLSIFKFFLFKIYSSFDLILCQSKGFKNHLSKKIKKKASLLYSWPEEIFYKNTNKNKFLKYKNNFKILFAGNIGKAQNLLNLSKAIELLKNNDKIKFFFIGDGSEKKNFEIFVNEKKLNNVIFIKKKNISKIPEFYNSADCLLISLSNKFSFNKTIPAKIQTYMVSKKPILALASGEVLKVVKDANCGYVSKSNNYKDFKKKILKMSKNNKKILLKLGNNGFNYAGKNFNRNKQLNTLLNSIKKYK